MAAIAADDRPVVVGAGPAGLAAAWALKRVGVEPVVLERANTVCSSWRGHYRGLRLNSPRRISSLPGMRMERELGRWVAREDFLAYVERYARRLNADVHFSVAVQRIDRDDGYWRLTTTAGELNTRSVVIATGLNGRPHIPDWPGRATYEGALIHATNYFDAAPFVGSDVLVVGLGASGTDIAVELARDGARRVRVSVRTPPLIYRRHLSTALMSQLVKHVPVPDALFDRLSLWLHRLQWRDLSSYGLQRPTEGMATSLSRRGHGATMDCGLISAVKEGALEIIPGVTGLDGRRVLLADGTSIEPDAVIAATGQQPSLDGLVGHLGLLAPPVGRPVVHGGRTAREAPNIYFLGFRLPAGQLPDLAIDARVIARRIASQRRRPSQSVGQSHVKRRSSVREDRIRGSHA